MTAGTNLVEVQEALITQLQARPGLAGIQISYTMPETELQNKSIWFEDASATLNLPTHSGRGNLQKMEESININGCVQVLAGQGQTQAAADTQAIELLAEIQQQLAEKPDITPDIMWGLMTSWSKSGMKLSTSLGHGSKFSFRINVKARLFP